MWGLFKRTEKGQLRHGVWCVAPVGGVYFHGDRNIVERSVWGLEDLRGLPGVVEITPDEAREIVDFTEGQALLGAYLGHRMGRQKLTDWRTDNGQEES